MRIGLIAVDKTSFPNIALAKDKCLSQGFYQGVD